MGSSRVVVYWDFNYTYTKRVIVDISTIYTYIGSSSNNNSRIPNVCRGIGKTPIHVYSGFTYSSSPLHISAVVIIIVLINIHVYMIYTYTYIGSSNNNSRVY